MAQLKKTYDFNDSKTTFAMVGHRVHFGLKRVCVGGEQLNCYETHANYLPRYYSNSL